MNHRKADKRKAADEMNGSRRLPAAKDSQERRKRRVHPWRHRQAGQDDQRSQPENHARVSDLLQDIIMFCFFSRGLGRYRASEASSKGSADPGPTARPNTVPDAR